MNRTLPVALRAGASHVFLLSPSWQWGTCGVGTNLGCSPLGYILSHKRSTQRHNDKSTNNNKKKQHKFIRTQQTAINHHKHAKTTKPPENKKKTARSICPASTTELALIEPSTFPKKMPMKLPGSWPFKKAFLQV